MSDIDTSLDTQERIKKVLALLEINNLMNMVHVYLFHHRERFLRGRWDPRKDSLVNRVKTELQEMDPAHLHFDTEDWRCEILQAWHHTTLFWVLWSENGLDEQERTDMAHTHLAELELTEWFHAPERQREQARLSRIWRFIMNGDLDQVEDWIGSLALEEDRLTARCVLSDYRRYGSRSKGVKPFCEVRLREPNPVLPLAVA